MAKAMKRRVSNLLRNFAVVALTWSMSPPAMAQATNYMLGTGSLLMGPAGGSNSIVLAVTPPAATWTATVNAAWLHVPADFVAGQGSTNVIFVCDSNAGPTRTGTLTIGGQTLSVIQAGSSYVPVRRPTLLAQIDYPDALAVDASGNVYIASYSGQAVAKWTATSNTTTLLETNVDYPEGIAVDGSGSVYFSTRTTGIKVWTPTTAKATTLIPAADFVTPTQLCLDGNGHLYILDQGNSAILKWTLGDQTLTTVLAEGLATPLGLALDKAGNLYVDPDLTDALDRVTSSNGDLSLLASFASTDPEGITGLAVDDGGNVYTGPAMDWAGSIRRWSAATKTVSNVATPGVKIGWAFALDAAENLYIADSDNNAVLEVPNAYFDPRTKVEGPQAGNDSLPPTVPASVNMAAPFAPTSDQAWLTITGVSNGVVNSSFGDNAGAGRTAHINLLGESIAIVQVAEVPRTSSCRCPIRSARLLGSLSATIRTRISRLYLRLMRRRQGDLGARAESYQISRRTHMRS